MAERARRRRAWRWFFAISITWVLILILVPAITYYVWQANARARLRAEIAAIPADEPLTTQELHDWHAVPPGERDITQLWLAAAAPFQGPGFDEITKELPILGTGAEVPGPHEPWPDESLVRAFLASYEREIANLHATAQEQGAVRYPRAYEQGININLEQVQQMRSVIRVLVLEFHVLMRENQIDAAIRNMETRVAFGETTAHEPNLIVMLIRMALHGITLESARQLAEFMPLSDEQLAKLQRLARQMTIERQIEHALLGERAMGYHMYHCPIDVISQDSDADEREFAIWTSRDGHGVSRADDCAMALKLYGEMIASSRLSLPDAIRSVGDIENEIRDLPRNHAFGKLRFIMVFLCVPAIQTAFTAAGRFTVNRDATDALLAIRRFELANGKPPATLTELVPKYLPAVPIDPFDSRPLRYAVRDDQAIVYSIGEDGVDDGGEGDPRDNKPDIVRRLR